MSYPLSSAVTAGQATEADQYNDLRRDALYLGQDPACSGNLLELLYQGSGDIRLTRVSAASIRLEASEEAPCALMIGGRICSVRSEVTLSLNSAVLPAPGRYGIYAVGGTDGSFSLRASAGAPAGGRQIGTFLWSGGGIIPGSVHDMKEWEQIRSAEAAPEIRGRLTLVSGEPVPDADIFYGETLYFTPYQGNSAALYLGGGWEVFRFTELSLRLSGFQRGIPHDVFLSADENGLQLSAQSWGTTGARPGGMLARQDGVRVSGGDSGKRYLGSFVLNAAGFGEDSRQSRLIWNENYRLPRLLVSRLSTTKNRGESHENCWAPYYDEDAPEVQVLLPAADAEFSLTGVGISSPISESDRGYSRSAAVGICRDMMKQSPYTGNENYAPVFTHSWGNGPMTVSVQNQDSSFLGIHSYTLAFWSNYGFYPAGTALAGVCGECPGLIGSVRG